LPSKVCSSRRAIRVISLIAYPGGSNDQVGETGLDTGIIEQRGTFVKDEQAGQVSGSSLDDVPPNGPALQPPRSAPE
jgi:hypothetical protein